MRNKLGLVQIKVRAKDSSAIDLSSITIDDLEITGNIKDAKGGKLIALDVYIVDENDDGIFYNGVTMLNEWGIVLVLALDTYSGTPVKLFFDETSFSIEQFE